MKRKQDIDDILKQWPFDPLSVNVRLLELRQREVLQMRVDMGILQMETKGRPDGHHFHGAETYYDFLVKKADSETNFKLNESQCFEIDREFVQFYHRRVCWLQLKEFDRAVRDAEHTLRLMDFCKSHSPDEQWTISHEQYRPFVLYHRTQAAALSWLNQEAAEPESEDNLEAGSETKSATKKDSRAEPKSDLQAEPDSTFAAEMAIEEVNQGLASIRTLFVEYEAEEQFDEDELVQRLIEFREGLREKYAIGQTLLERLNSAVENEDYELAATLRDEIEKRSSP